MRSYQTRYSKNRDILCIHSICRLLILKYTDISIEIEDYTDLNVRELWNYYIDYIIVIRVYNTYQLFYLVKNLAPENDKKKNYLDTCL